MPRSACDARAAPSALPAAGSDASSAPPAPISAPESPIATREACDLVDGNFRESVFGWMVHANVFAGEDNASIWGDDHAGHDMHEGMKMDASVQHP